MPPRLISQEGRQTHFVIWTLAVLCAILTIAVIVAGIAVFVVYMVYQPKMPYIRVAYAHLDELLYDQLGLLEIDITLNLEAVNDNNKAHTSFSALSFLLQFHDIDVAVLKSNSLEVPKNSSRPLNYHFHSSPIPLDQDAKEAMDKALRRGIVPFDLRGHAKTRWKVGIFVSVRFWTHISCRLHFFQTNGSTVESGCSTTSH
ncbi:uncharacterized protein LOC122043085 [Zingiber officinale]|uniref:Late embryogenesis abundant protein LEA-2 subgroup domain-containing protein n=1 Tax=Zingiber officinale TaxID=94328 RepID=A0A8J5I9T7_ZINOF|nr:uncharacterized protein LOC122043085 [Zingiber officinale]KAG6530200.1 hypothetical protein ZIOFF_012422 [Zingiber officinale]